MDLQTLNQIFPTLFAKTFFILSSQLFITWLTTAVTGYLLSRGREDALPASEAEEQAAEDKQKAEIAGKLFSKNVFKTLFYTNAVVFLVLCFWGIHQSFIIALALFSLWSVLTGIQLEAILVTVGDGLGRSALALTATIVFATGLVGLYSHVDLGFLKPFLFIALLILICFNCVRLLGRFDRGKQKMMAMAGVVLFTLYLVVDFNFLLFRKAAGVNDWNAAFNAALGLYLDIINLFLDLLDAMSK